jgi:hypothetical protein
MNKEDYTKIRRILIRALRKERADARAASERKVGSEANSRVDGVRKVGE